MESVISWFDISWSAYISSIFVQLCHANMQLSDVVDTVTRISYTIPPDTQSTLLLYKSVYKDIMQAMK